MLKLSVLKRVIAALSAMAVMGFCLTGCSSQTEDSESDSGEEAAQTGEILNFIEPQEGEQIAVMEVKDYGTIKIKLFPDAVPKAVENFVGLANMNYYDELIFHRVIKEFMNQGGDPKGNGTGGNSMWGGSFDGGIGEGLYHFSGAVAYANSGSTSTNGSQFYIVNTPDGYVLGGLESAEDFAEAGYDLPDNVIETYLEKGGTPYLDGSYTVFGQVFEGMDVVRAIAEVETDENDKPLTQVVIESVRIVEYTANGQ